MPVPAPVPELAITPLTASADIDQVRSWLPDDEVLLPAHDTISLVAHVAPVAIDERAGVAGEGATGENVGREGGAIGHVAARRRTDRQPGWTVDRLTVTLSAEPAAVAASAALLRAVLDHVRVDGGGPVVWWVTAVGDLQVQIAEAAGFRAERDIYQLRLPLPAGEPFEIDTRSFVVGEDEAAWVEVNNRAFSWHPEQGGWTVDTIVEREQEPWFDADGFLLHERDGRLAAFCWTKVHEHESPRLGEIYVIAVDPDFGGQGLGRAIVLAGLDNLYRRHQVDVGMLYVDASNTAGVKLYDKLGFTRHQTDRGYVADA